MAYLNQYVMFNVPKKGMYEHIGCRPSSLYVVHCKHNVWLQNENYQITYLTGSNTQFCSMCITYVWKHV